jgi:hypothetical protein
MNFLQILPLLGEIVTLVADLFDNGEDKRAAEILRTVRALLEVSETSLDAWFDVREAAAGEITPDKLAALRARSDAAHDIIQAWVPGSPDDI